MAPDPGGIVEITFYDSRGRVSKADDARVILEAYAQIRTAKELVQLQNPMRGTWSIIDKDRGTIIIQTARPIEGIPIIKPKGERDAANS